MSEPSAVPRWRRFRKYLLWVGLPCVVLSGLVSWYTTTDSFQGMVRRRLVAELERITGGTVELGAIHTIPFHFQVDIRDLTIHGREGANEVPYVHIGRLVAQVKLISALGFEVGFSSLVLDHPVVHLIVYPDGTTNQPAPGIKATSGRSPVDQLFSLSIDQLEVRRGELLYNDIKTPFDFVARDVAADMTYSLLHRRYDGNLLLGKIDTKIKDYRPIAWMAEVHFGLGRDSAEIKSLKVSSGRSRLSASGRLENFRQLRLSGKYDLTLDLAEASAVVHQPEVREGAVRVAGEGSWSLASFSSSGKLLLKDFDWRDQSVRLHGATLSSDYAVDSRRLALSQVQAKLLGGEINGDAEVRTWLNSPAEGTLAKQNASDEQKGNVRLKFKDLSASEIAAALSTSSRPLQRMNLAGAARGTVDARWRGSLRNAESDLVVDVSAPASVSARQLPMNAHLRAQYRAATDDLEVAEFEASTRATQVHATGTLSRKAALAFSISTVDLREWQPVLADVGYERLPVLLRGHASFTGTATGKLSDIDFAGKLQSEDFDVLIPATARTPAKQLHCDSVVADVELSPHAFVAHNGRLHHANTAVSFDIGLGLQERKFTDASQVTAKLEVRNADVDEALALAGYDYPVGGTFSLVVQVEGTGAEPRGSGHIELADAAFRGQPIQRIESRFDFNRDQVSLNDLHLVYSDAHVVAAGSYNFSTQAFHFDLTGNNFDLARIPELQSTRVRVDGRMDFTAQASGTLHDPVINARLSLRDLAFDHEPAGNYLLDAETKGSELKVNGRSQFKTAELNLDGTIQLRGDMPALLTLHFNRLDVDSVLRTYLRGQVTGHSAVAGDLQLRGPLRRPHELEILGNLNDFFADVESIRVRNSGPISFTISNQLVSIQQFHLLGEGTDLSLGGTVRMNGERELDLHAQGHANLQLIQSLNPDFTSSGEVSVDLTVGGTVNKPTTQGRLQIANGSIAYSDLPSALSGINGSLVFNQDRLQIETLTAHVGGGTVNFGGYATAYNRQLNFDLTLHTEGVRLRYPPGVSSMADADLRWTGTSKASVLSGDVTITKLAVTPGFDFGASLARSAQSSSLPQTNPLLNRIRMDVHIETTPELQMQTAVVRLSGDADLHLRGTLAKPVLLGRADITEGEVYFNGTKYRMERGDVIFVNPVTTTPVLDLQASTHVRDYDITINLNGPVDKLNSTYRSEPPLPVADIISLLALGQTQQQSAQMQQSGQSPFAQQASSAILSEALNSAISNRARSLFGISHIRVDPQGMATETSPTTSAPAVTIEQQVKDNLTLTYTTNVSQTSQQIIQAEYNVTRNVSILALRDYNGVISFEVRIRQRKK